MTTSPSIYLIALWPLAFMGVWAVWNIVRDSLDEALMRRSLDWPEAQGKVTDSKTVWAHFEVSYEYSTPSGCFTGKYKMNFPVVAPDRYAQGAARLNNEAKQDLADYPIGANVIVKYNPKQHQQSVLYCRGEIGQESVSGDRGVAPKFMTLS